MFDRGTKKNDTHYLPPKHNKNSRPVPTICMGVSGAASSSDMIIYKLNKCTVWVADANFLTFSSVK